MIDIDLPARFQALFRGLELAHGTYQVEDDNPGSPKKEIKRTAKTLRQPVTAELWAKHLDGSRPLGICPINEKNVCYWGAVDIDVYDLVHSDIVIQLKNANIPAVVCKTKSGGAHVYLFFTEAIPAGYVMERLRDLAAYLGHGGCEVFPKQNVVHIDKGDLGNWLNMPYFGGDSTTRFAVRGTGQGLSMTQFLEVADRVSISRAQLISLSLQRKAAGFEDGPPCLQTLAAAGFPEGSRNNGLFNLATFLKKKYPDKWEDMVEAHNQTHMKPPLSREEVSAVIKSHRKKDYNYKCKDQPIVSFCNQVECRRREYGIGRGGEVSVLEALTMYKADPPIYFATLKTGETVQVSFDELREPNKFQAAVANQVGRLLPLCKIVEWHKMLAPIYENKIEIEAPPEAGISGNFRELIEEYLTARYRAETPEEVLVGKPWLDENTNLIYFQLKGLMDALHAAKFTEYGRNTVATKLRDMGAENGRLCIREGEYIRAFSIDANKVDWHRASLPLPKRKTDAI